MNNVVVGIATIVTMILYGVIYSLIPEDFGFKSKIDPYYFSLTTMSTVGYGDFSPKTPRAKILVMSQQIVLLTEVLTLLSNILSNKPIKKNNAQKNVALLNKNNNGYLKKD